MIRDNILKVQKKWNTGGLEAINDRYKNYICHWMCSQRPIWVKKN